MKHLPIALILAGMMTSAAAQQAWSPDAARCDALREQFDQLAAASKTEGHYTGRMERDIGADLCRRGHYVAGIQELEKAIRLLGFRPG